MITNRKFSCSFCKRQKQEVERLIVSKGEEESAYICNHCVDICHNALQKTDLKVSHINISQPKDIYWQLSKTVYGQEEAKKFLSVAAYNHLQRIKNPTFEKSNILLIGKSGSGKTLLVETLSKILNVPCASVDATTLTEVGYTGQDVSDCIQQLFENSNYNVESTEKGIVFIDEIDKVRSTSSLMHEIRDVSGKGVQQSLLKLIEDTMIPVSTNGNGKFSHDNVTINTKNILFICAGHFSDLQSIIEKENKNFINEEDKLLSIKGPMKKKKYAETMKFLTTKNLEEYGIIKELAGRLPIKIVLDELDSSDLTRIMTMENGILNQFKKRFLIEDVELSWDEEAVEKIAKDAYKENIGARALKSVVEKMFLQTMFEIADIRGKYNLCITKNSIEKLPVGEKFR